MTSKHSLPLLISLIVCFLLTVPLSISFAQLVVSPGQSAVQLANVIAGNGVNVNNVTYTGVNAAAGTFDGTNTNLGLDDGVILTSGNINLAVGPNNLPSAGSDNGAASYPGITNSFNASVLEFDFIPADVTVSFQYVFASEEYSEFVCQQFNDGFEILLSGPGIAGQKNIALVPSTTTPVSINTVNNGSSSIIPLCFGGASPNPTNPAYFVDNENPAGTSVQYDGFTTVMTASSAVSPCQVYHLVFAIYDLADPNYDSGVFIKEGSLTSGTITVDVNDANICAGDVATLTASVNTPGGLYSWSTGETTQAITVSPASSATYTVDYTIGPCNLSYTATSEVNVSTGSTINLSITPSSASVCPGQSTVLTGTASAGGSAQSGFVNSTTVPIVDAGIFGATTQTISSIPVSGLNFATISTGSIASVCVNISHTYVGDLELGLRCPSGTIIPLSLNNGAGGDNYTNTCFVSSGAGAITAGTAPFTGNFLPQTAMTNLNGCNSNGTWDLIVVDEGFGDVGNILNWTITFNNQATITSFSWSPTNTLTGSNTLTPTASPTTTTTYTLTATSSTGCSQSTSVTIFTDTLGVTIVSSDASCSAPTGAAVAIASGGASPYTYAWSSGATSLSVSGLAGGAYTVTVTDANGCAGVKALTIGVGGSPTGPPGQWTWEGNVNSSWFDPCNWDKLSVPDTSSNVLVPGSTTFQPLVTGDSAWCKDLTINWSNGGLIFIDVFNGGYIWKKP